MMLRVIFHTRRAADKTSSLGTKTYFRHYRAGPSYLRLPYFFLFFFFLYSQEEARDKRAAGNNTGPGMGEEMG